MTAGLALRSWAVVGASAGAAAAAGLAAGGPVAAIAAGTAALGAGALLAVALLRPFQRTIEGLGAAITSFKENDFSVRLVELPAARELAERFNALGQNLRRERNTLYQKELMLETVLEAASFAVVLADGEGTVVLANAAARELFGGARIAGEAFAPLVAKLIPAGTRDDALVEVATPRGRELLHVSARTFELNAERHTLHLFRSMTREVARQQVEVWKRTVRLIGHELGNSLGPIGSLVGSARTIVEKPEHAAKMSKILGTIEERADHLLRFLEGYASIARLPAPTSSDVAWAPFVEALAALYPVRLPSPLPQEPGWFDEGQIQQVLINLLKNAVESGSAREQVELVVTARAGGGVEVEVRDRGSGLSDEALARAAQIFFSTKPGGSGLGLTLAREIVEAHGGELALERREGGGAAARFWLPGKVTRG